MITPRAALTIDTISRAEKRTRSRASSNCDALEKTCVNAMAKIKDTRTLTCWNMSVSCRLPIDSVLEPTFVLGAIEMAFRFRDQSVVANLPKFVAADQRSDE